MTSFFCATKDSSCEEFVATMQGEFEISIMGGAFVLSWTAGQAIQRWNFPMLIKVLQRNSQEI